MPLSNPLLAALDDGNQVFNVRHPLFGARAAWDGCTVTAAFNSATWTVSGLTVSAAMVGRILVVDRAGGAGGDTDGLRGAIVSVNVGANTVTTSGPNLNPAGVAGAMAVIGYDDVPAIQAAIDAAAAAVTAGLLRSAVVFIPAGNYLLSDGATYHMTPTSSYPAGSPQGYKLMMKDGVTLLGAGRGATILTSSPEEQNANTLCAFEKSDFAIRGIAVDDTYGDYIDCFKAIGSSRFVIEDCRATACPAFGFQAVGCTDGLIRECIATDPRLSVWKSPGGGGYGFSCANVQDAVEGPSRGVVFESVTTLRPAKGGLRVIGEATGTAGRVLDCAVRGLVVRDTAGYVLHLEYAEVQASGIDGAPAAGGSGHGVIVNDCKATVVGPGKINGTAGANTQGISVVSSEATIIGMEVVDANPYAIRVSDDGVAPCDVKIVGCAGGNLVGSTMTHVVGDARTLAASMLTYDVQPRGSVLPYDPPSTAALKGTAARVASWSRRTLLVSEHGGDYATLSAALAAVTDAASSKPYTILVAGQIAETAQLTPKSWVDVEGLGGAAVTVTAGTDSANAVELGSATNCKWRNLRIVRAGALTSSGNSTVSAAGAADRTFVLEDCRIDNACTGTSGSITGRALTVGSGSPLFRRCVFRSADFSHAAQVSGGSPELQDCETRPTEGAAGTNSGAGLRATGNGVAVTIRGGLIQGSPNASGGGGAGLSVDQGATVTMIGGEVRGGAAGSNAHAVFVFGGSSAGTTSGIVHLDGVRIFATVGDGVHATEAAAGLLTRCAITGGRATTYYDLSLAGTSALVVQHCETKRHLVYTQHSIAASTSFVPSASHPLRLLGIDLSVSATGTSVSLGWSAAATDIVNAQSTASTGRKAITLPSTAQKVLAAGGSLFPTVTGGGTVVLGLVWEVSYAQNSVLLDTAGETRLEDCAIRGSAAADAVSITSVARTANRWRLLGGVVECPPLDTSPKKAVVADAAYAACPIYGAVLLGGTTNVTCATATANGSSWEV